MNRRGDTGLVQGVSHITFVVRDLARMGEILETVLEARLVYRSGPRHYSRSPERFYDIGGTWVAVMEGEPLPGRSYNHVAFAVRDADLDECARRIAALGLDLLESRPRMPGEGRSIYFYDADNHLFELHSGTLAERLARYAAEDAL